RVVLLGTPASGRRRTGSTRGRNGSTHRTRAPVAATRSLRPGTRDSLASLGWRDAPPCPPRVGVLARWAGGVCQSTGVERGSRRLPPRLTTYHLRLATPSLRPGGCASPHPPRGSAH